MTFVPPSGVRFVRDGQFALVGLYDVNGAFYGWMLLQNGRPIVNIESSEALTEYTKEEWQDIIMKIRPELTQEQFDKLWDDFQYFKSRKRIQ